MKKTILIATILLVSVISTACINNLAVQDLNNKAKSYMEQGDYSQAIERLKSSLDLDSSVFETHYNLAVAYTKSEDYINAMKEFEKAAEIKPNNPDVYYSLATAQNNLSVDMEQGVVRMNIDDELYAPKSDEVDFDKKYVMSEKEMNYVSQLKEAAISNYKKYLELSPNAPDKDDVEAQIKVLSKVEE